VRSVFFWWTRLGEGNSRIETEFIRFLAEIGQWVLSQILPRSGLVRRIWPCGDSKEDPMADSARPVGPRSTAHWPYPGKEEG